MASAGKVQLFTSNRLRLPCLLAPVPLVPVMSVQQIFYLISPNWLELSLLLRLASATAEDGRDPVIVVGGALYRYRWSAYTKAVTAVACVTGAAICRM